MASYVKENSPPFPVYFVDDNFPNTTIALTVTPRTLVFSPDGLFIRGWNGIYTGETKMQISSYFGVKLPD
jgi:hypothetical protein